MPGSLLDIMGSWLRLNLNKNKLKCLRCYKNIVHNGSPLHCLRGRICCQDLVIQLQILLFEKYLLLLYRCFWSIFQTLHFVKVEWSIRVWSTNITNKRKESIKTTVYTDRSYGKENCYYFLRVTKIQANQIPSLWLMKSWHELW